MSEGIVVALIGFAGAVLGAAIAGFAAIAAAGTKKEGQTSLSCGLLGLFASLGAAGGLVLGALFGSTLIQRTMSPQPTNPISVQPQQPTGKASTVTFATPTPFVTNWIQEVGQVPESGTQLSWRLSPGQTLYLSGGQFQIGNVFCGGDAEQICVLIYQTSIEQTLTINSLIPRHNYIGITEILSPDEILKEKEPVFWIPPNCTSGCKRATVLIFRDGKLENKMSFTAS